MKLSVALFSLLFSFQVQAATLPKAIEARLIGAVLDMCSISLNAEFTLVSLKTEETKVDQGQSDVTYDAVFKTTAFGVNEQTVVTEMVRVIGVVSAMSNPAVDNFQALSVTSSNKNLCD